MKILQSSSITYNDWIANTICTMTPTNTIMPMHLKVPFVLALCAAPLVLDAVADADADTVGAGVKHTLLKVVFPYRLTQDSQFPISEAPVEFELGVHSHVVKVVLTGVAMLWVATAWVVLLVVAVVPICAQQM